VRGRDTMKREKEYIIFCDESDSEGTYFSNFFGGVIVGAADHDEISRQLNWLKSQLNLYGEVKWSKVTERYLDKYKALMDRFMDLVVAGTLKIRIMFTQNAYQAKGLSADHLDNTYFLLYYQFIKHGFGLSLIPSDGQMTHIRLYFDQFPHTREKVVRFRGFLLGLNDNYKFRNARIRFRSEDIAEVRSHDHVLLQCLDIVLGAMNFRLNDKHKEKPPGQRLRGKRTRAKEQLYKFLLDKIRQMRPNFNIGVSTAGNEQWETGYAHWRFVSRGAEFDAGRTKGFKRKGPTEPTSEPDA